MIVGVDVSSRRIDLAWLENGRPQRWHQDLAKGHLIDRLRSIRVEWPSTVPAAVFDEALSAWVTSVDWAPGHGISDVAIEYPFGRGNAIAALMSTVGVITRQAPPWARVAWPSSGELRAAIGAKNTKASAHDAVHRIACPGYASQSPDMCLLYGWDEHELDALIACIGWTRILEAQDAT